MVIVAGSIMVRQGTRDQFVRLSVEAVRSAREHDDCVDFAVSPDPVDSNRVNVFEVWTSYEALSAFRGAGPDDELASLIERAAIAEYDAALRES